jgi:uncharacterized protein YwqG
MEYPKGTKGEFKNKPLYLLAQINFEEIPKIPNFPESGILQFFIAANDMYGMNWGNLTTQDEFRIIYHKEIIKDESKLLDFMPEITRTDMLPFKGEYKLVSQEIETMYADTYSEDFTDVFVDCANKILDEPINSIYDIDDDFIEEMIWNRNSREKAFIGGYPFFTQSDPRYKKEIADCNIVLFELDSFCDNKENIDIMWGDCGTGVFLIPEENLKNLDFSKVLYNYDCY